MTPADVLALISAAEPALPELVALVREIAGTANAEAVAKRLRALVPSAASAAARGATDATEEHWSDHIRKHWPDTGKG